MNLRKLISFIFVLLFSPCAVFSQSLQPVVNDAFIPGERFTFAVYYDSYVTGRVTAGSASLDVSFQKKQIDGRQVYHATGAGKSKGAFNLFFKVEDRFESFIDAEYMVPLLFKRKTREGDYRKEDEVRFNQFMGTASSRTINRQIPRGTQDFISAFYYARTLDLSKLRPGDYFPMSFFLDDSVYVTRIYFEGTETVTCEAGTFRCLKFKPMVATGNVFSQPYPMTVWVTDDKYRIPVLLKSAVVVGSVKMELTGYQGLAGVPESLTVPGSGETR